MSELSQVIHDLIDVVSGRKAQLSHEEADALHEVVDGATAAAAPAPAPAPAAAEDGAPVDPGAPEPGPQDGV